MKPCFRIWFNDDYGISYYPDEPIKFDFISKHRLVVWDGYEVVKENPPEIEVMLQERKKKYLEEYPDGVNYWETEKWKKENRRTQ